MKKVFIILGCSCAFITAFVFHKSHSSDSQYDIFINIEEGRIFGHPLYEPMEVSIQSRPDEKCKIMPGDILEVKSLSGKYAMLTSSWAKYLVVSEAVVEKNQQTVGGDQEGGACPVGANLTLEVICGDLLKEENWKTKCKWYPKVRTACFFVDCTPRSPTWRK